MALLNTRRLNDFDLNSFNPPELQKRFVVRFPERLERLTENVDDKLMYWAQRLRSKPVYLWNLFVNGTLGRRIGGLVRVPGCQLGACVRLCVSSAECMRTRRWFSGVSDGRERLITGCEWCVCVCARACGRVDLWFRSGAGD